MDRQYTFHLCGVTLEPHGPLRRTCTVVKYGVFAVAFISVSVLAAADVAGWINKGGRTCNDFAEGGLYYERCDEITDAEHACPNMCNVSCVWVAHPHDAEPVASHFLNETLPGLCEDDATWRSTRPSVGVVGPSIIFCTIPCSFCLVFLIGRACKLYYGRKIRAAVELARQTGTVSQEERQRERETADLPVWRPLNPLAGGTDTITGFQVDTISQDFEPPSLAAGEVFASYAWSPLDVSQSNSPASSDQGGARPTAGQSMGPDRTEGMVHVGTVQGVILRSPPPSAATQVSADASFGAVPAVKVFGLDTHTADEDDDI